MRMPKGPSPDLTISGTCCEITRPMNAVLGLANPALCLQYRAFLCTPCSSVPLEMFYMFDRAIELSAFTFKRFRALPRRRVSLVAPIALALCLSSSAANAQKTKYTSAQEAYGVGAAFYNSRNFASAREPFEAALKMSEDERKKVEIHRALLASYRVEGKTDNFVSSAEYVITHSSQPAEQSLTTRELLSFVRERNLTDNLVKKYEAQLKKKADDRTALYLLSEIYANLKREPKRAAELLDRLAALDKKSGKPLDVAQQAQLAQQYVQAKKFKEGAEIYEEIAPQDEKLAAWHWKEAADAWLRAGKKDKALTAAKKSADSKPETRSELLTHFWHKKLADVFLETGEAALAVPHYEEAIAKTTIDGYIKDSQKKLAEAKEKAGK